MPAHPLSTGARRALLAALVSVAVALAAGGVSSLQAQTQFQYAAKFVCGPVAPGTPAAGLLANGAYFTAVNVHNPNPQALDLRKKFAVALPGEKAGPVSQFFGAVLQPDQALEIDCADILQHLKMKGFVKGFVVILSPRELDVVAVYTAAGSPGGPVVTLELERVPKRP
jgi:hypothetical protein